jgi:hypothetical protein
MHESIAALPRLIRTHRWPTDAYLMLHGAVASAAFTAPPSIGGELLSTAAGIRSGESAVRVATASSRYTKS